jgi:hypothetical protein
MSDASEPKPVIFDQMHTIREQMKQVNQEYNDFIGPVPRNPLGERNRVDVDVGLASLRELKRLADAQETANRIAAHHLIIEEMKVQQHLKIDPEHKKWLLAVAAGEQK